MEDKHDPFGGSLVGSTSHVEETWLMSYADLVTNLLVMFVLMVSASSSNVSSVKVERIKSAITGGSNPETPSISKTHDDIVKKVQEMKVTDHVEVIEADQSIKIVIKDKLLFDLGRTDIKPEN